jgi:ribosomal protein S18 acetylase RimI-like enzyme
MIRPTVHEDTPAILALTEGTGLFNPLDMEALKEVLDDYHATNRAWGHLCVTDERDGQIIGFAYYAPAAMTDRAWYLWWIAVSKQTQARGIGGELLRHVEDNVRARQGRLLLIETSSLSTYELTRRFYLKNGYELHAVLRDFYSDGQDMVIFRKRLLGRDAPSASSAAPASG